MTHDQFKILLSIYLALVILSFLQPKEDLDEKIVSWFKSLKKPQILLALVVSISIFSAGIIGYIGLLILWVPAPYIFFGAVLVRASCDYFLLGAAKGKGFSAFLAHSTFAIEVFMAYAVFFGPAKRLFNA